MNKPYTTSTPTVNTGTTGTGRFIQYELQFRTPAETNYLITCEDGSQFDGCSRCNGGAIILTKLKNKKSNIPDLSLTSNFEELPR